MTTLERVRASLKTTRALEAFEFQREKGIRKYGHDVDSPNTPESYLDWIRHPLEEYIDLVVYLEKIRSLPEFENLDDRRKSWFFQLQRNAIVGANVWGLLYELEQEKYPEIEEFPRSLDNLHKNVFYRVEFDVIDNSELESKLFPSALAAQSAISKTGLSRAPHRIIEMEMA